VLNVKRPGMGLGGDRVFWLDSLARSSLSSKTLVHYPRPLRPRSRSPRCNVHRPSLFAMPCPSTAGALSIMRRHFRVSIRASRCTAPLCWLRRPSRRFAHLL
jgi:hypothetical protein